VQRAPAGHAAALQSARRDFKPMDALAIDQNRAAI
jgi:hypothetical protein